MKKILFAILPAVALLFASCDPIHEENGPGANMAVETLQNGVTLSQATAMSNDFTFTTSPATYIQIYDAKGIQLAKGTAGAFTFAPSRGSDTHQILTIKAINPDGSVIECTKEVDVTVAADLTPEVKLLVSDSGVKVWKWNTAAPGGQVWGNLGAGDNSFSGKDFALNGTGKWWGVTCENDESGAGAGFMQQLGHTHDGQAHGDESMDATMVISEDGTIKCYDADGNLFREGTYEIKDYDPTYSKNSRYCGILKISAGAILFPYEINSGGNMPTELEIAYLSSSRLVLTYPDNGDWASTASGEGTFWQFCSTSDVIGCLTDNDEATWTWDDENPNGSWGSAGYSSIAYAGADAISGGQWWGCPATDIAGQVEEAGYPYADGIGATMTFSSDGGVTKSSGGSGTFLLDLTNTSDLGGYNEGKTLGRLTTTGAGILFAHRVNPGTYPDLSATIDEFDIAYISDDNLVLAAPSNYSKDGHGSWEECTFWRFKKVK